MCRGVGVNLHCKVRNFAQIIKMLIDIGCITVISKFCFSIIWAFCLIAGANMFIVGCLDSV